MKTRQIFDREHITPNGLYIVEGDQGLYTAIYSFALMAFDTNHIVYRLVG